MSDRAIRAAVAGGACDLDDVAERCGAGDDCGGCVPTIEELLADAAFAVARPDEVAARQAGRRCPTHPVPAHAAPIHQVPAQAGAGAAFERFEELEATA